MIKNKDRSKWFGASDTHIIMGSWNTKTFIKWWCVKLGLLKNGFKTKETMAGDAYEHKIAKAVEEDLSIKLKLDRQIKIKKLRIRVNLDADCKKLNKIFEIKTFKEIDDWKPPINYYEQVQVQMYFTKMKASIVAYPMTKEYYKNYFLPIEKEKLQFYDFELDNEFIQRYLARLKVLVKCLKKKILPKQEMIEV